MEEENLESEKIENEGNAIEPEVVVEIGNVKEADKDIEETKKKKRTPKDILRILAFIIGAIILWVGLVQYMAADKYDATVKVKTEDSSIGVNPTGEKLDYGDIPRGSSMIRSITVENGGNMDVYIKVIKYGEIAELIDEEDDGFVLPGGEKKNIEFTLDIPISAEEKEYKGKVLIFKLPKVF